MATQQEIDAAANVPAIGSTGLTPPGTTTEQTTTEAPAAPVQQQPLAVGAPAPVPVAVAAPLAQPVAVPAAQAPVPVGVAAPVAQPVVVPAAIRQLVFSRSLPSMFWQRSVAPRREACPSAQQPPP